MSAATTPRSSSSAVRPAAARATASSPSPTPKDACQYRQELTSTGDVITTVSQNPNAIGYASLAAVKDSVKALTVGGVAPTEATVKDGSYLVQRPFVLVTKDGAALSETAQSVLRLRDLCGRRVHHLCGGRSRRWPEPHSSVQAAGIRSPFAYTRGADMKKRSSKFWRRSCMACFCCLASSPSGACCSSAVYLIVSGIPAIRKIGLVPFLFGKTWASTAAEPSLRHPARSS